MRIAIAGATGVVGRHVVQAAEAHGHQTVRLSRRLGVDVVTGDGLGERLDRVDAIVDVLNAPSLEQEPATAFFRAAAGNLQRLGAEHGVGRLVTLSIVGIDRVPFGYYAAKLEHERASADGPVAQATLRATQFHEFPAQQLAAGREGDRASVFDVTVRTVAARTVADVLVQTAEASSTGRVRDLGGPDRASLVDLARAYAARHVPGLTVVADSERMADLPADALVPDETARLEGPTFSEWLESDDAAAVSP